MENLSALQTHHNHRKWLGKLDFFQDEIKYYQNRVAEVMSKNTKPEVVEKVKSYRHLIFKMLEEIDEFRHQIYINEYYLAYFKEQHLATGKVIEPDENLKMLEMEKFSFNYRQFRKKLNRFLADIL